MPFRHLAYSLYACNSNILNMVSTARSSELFTGGGGAVRHCSSSSSGKDTLSRNTTLAEDKPAIALPPTKKLAIVTCMDARINPFAQLGIKMGEAHIIRNAGGMARDALRSLLISQRLLGTREIAVYHHTGCGMATFSKPNLTSLITDGLKSGDEKMVERMVDEMDFLEWPGVSSVKSEKEEDPLLASLKSEVNFLRTHPLIVRGTKVSGWVWDVGREEATRILLLTNQSLT
ncbi:carbonic anhydrase [Lentinula aciculospora]|uniref:Carbonic anhydrase n=1 Tax=Lentinula aciculospora TaxID=153920 RepID=A0A9W9DMG0_9AGAR|nr:carbonic anhydrase [Lentinula aciculospora]